MSLRRVFGRPWTLLAVAVAVACGGLPGNARGEGVELLPPVFGASERYAADANRAALYGFDPVSYFTDPRPRYGTIEHEILRDGLVWRFASAANEAAFLRDPDSFSPRIGGYDTASAARGLVVAATPDLFAIRQNRLYLFRTDAGRARFLADEKLAAEAERRWPDLRNGLVKD